MYNAILKWIREHYNRAINSIAFYPAIIAVLFVGLSLLTLEIDYSQAGKALKAKVWWIKLQDADTARAITSTVTAGILSLAVFSFSMVMIVMNQAASQMSNRVLESITANRFQQAVLGFYIGTIVYALFLLSAIRDRDSGVLVPAISVYTLILLTIIDIFLFIYFLHYVTESIKYETIIKRIHAKTVNSYHKVSDNGHLVTPQKWDDRNAQILVAPKSGYFQSYNKKKLLHFAKSKNKQLSFLHSAGMYVLEGLPFFEVRGQQQMTEKEIKQLFLSVDFYTGQPISINPLYGFRQLTEVAVKALSPGINDPGTAVESLHALCDLLKKCIQGKQSFYVEDADGIARIFLKRHSFNQLVTDYLYPIWDYGKNDRYVQKEMKAMLEQLITLHPAIEEEASIAALLRDVTQKVASF